MASYQLERIRVAHEENEGKYAQICKVLGEKPKGQKAKVMQQHAVSKSVDEIVLVNAELRSLYLDSDDLLKEELAAIGPNMFNSFYDTLNTTRAYHTRFVNENESMCIDVVGALDSSSNSSSSSVTGEVAGLASILFTGEEVFGKYLDLHGCHLLYCSLPGVSVQDYLQYLDTFYGFADIPVGCKSSRAYRVYLDQLLEYLVGFLSRVQPLFGANPLNIQELEAVDDFEARWRVGSITAWTTTCKLPSSSPPSALQMQLDQFTSVQELESLGSECLRQALEARGLKSGGTLLDRATRLLSVRGLNDDQVPVKLKSKATLRSTEESGASDGRRIGKGVGAGIDWRKELAWTEHRIVCLVEFMKDVVVSTRRHTEKQQARTKDEKDAELRDEEQGFLPETTEDGTLAESYEGNDDDVEAPIYNPKNIPLGWDGKPIPYWMYKLHGLNIEFKCEICGNQSYWGRQAFDRHFQQPRHAQGMRSLGVPNTKHFHDITKISDALELFSRLKDEIAHVQFQSDFDEEYQDSHGNVLNKRTYEDFTRQGLL